jgi:uncharacterized phage infection (PIP) family protein YhgE
MNFVGRANSANNESEQKLKGEVRQSAPQGSDHVDQVDDVKLTINDLENLTRRMSLASTREIDSLIGELETLRQKLATDGSRLERQLAEYAGLSQSVTQLTKIISEGLTHLEKGPSLRESPVAWQ